MRGSKISVLFLLIMVLFAGRIVTAETSALAAFFGLDISPQLSAEDQYIIS